MEKPQPSVPPKRGRPKKSAITLGINQTARIQSKRVIKDMVNGTNLNPALKLALISGIGVLVSYIISKR